MAAARRLDRGQWSTTSAHHAGDPRTHRTSAKADRIHQVALDAGMVPITQAALEMARKGWISLTEAYRVRAD
jgi:hypothetical protein